MTLEFMLGLAVAIVLIFTILKIVEMQYIDKDTRALKLFIRDAVYVFISGFVTLFLYNTYEKHILDFFFFLTNTKNIAVPDKTPIFIGEPGF